MLHQPLCGPAAAGAAEGRRRHQGGRAPDGGGHARLPARREAARGLHAMRRPAYGVISADRLARDQRPDGMDQSKRRGARMKVYVTPQDWMGKGIKRVARALAKHVPDGVKVVGSPADADLVLYHVVGWGSLPP